MKKAELLKLVVGKTIKAIRVNKFEASDSCSVGTFEIDFTDGSCFSMAMNSRPLITASFWKSDKSDGQGCELVKP